MRAVRGFRVSYDTLGRLVDLMREIGAGHGGKTPAQVALNWVICQGAVPIPGAKSARQAGENAGAAGWRLTTEEVAALEAADL
jgi:aryl-alcohol dehydrogenase-like predicted oxidoreductase